MKTLNFDDVKVGDKMTKKGQSLILVVKYIDRRKLVVAYVDAPPIAFGISKFAFNKSGYIYCETAPVYHD